MDQDSFRKLLHAPKVGSSGSAGKAARNAILPASAHGKKAKTKNPDPAQPAFKPRTVKKLDQYRDRAGERRQGAPYDYAQVEALAEDFEKRNADEDPETLEEQRKYLGGDSEHTVLVKGLDFALLEQNKARLAAESTVDDDVLEQAFAEGSSQVPKKRTREDIVRELKNKRAKGEDGAPPSAAAAGSDAPIDEAKKSGKFKPIGFKPIGSSDAKSKKKKVKESDKDGLVKKRKKKAAEPTPAEGESKPTGPYPATESTLAPTPASVRPKRGPPSPEPEPIDEDDDIFAGADDYTGIEVGDDEDEDAGDAEDTAKEPKDISDGEIPDSAPPPRRWVDIDEPSVLAPKSQSPERKSEPPPPAKNALPEHEVQREEGEEEEQPIKLQPLASSSVPSIRELLAMDEAKEREEKRKARREKKKGKKTKSGDDSE